MSAGLAPMTVVGGDYRIVRPLQAGGMGAVYVAEQISTGKLRALKVMHAQLVEDETQRERFVREARLAARVQSEHVVEVLAAGVGFDTGAPWLAMELLEGCDLSQLIKRQGAINIEQAMPIMEQLCHGLAAAHDEGIVHRDLKPRNIFFSKLRSSTHPWTIKILDFGIAKLVADPALAATAALGSPAWMAPEQTETGTGIAPATDIWALALVLFWMLTGRVYWRTANHPDAGMQTVLREMLFEPLDTPSERARSLGSGAPFPKQLDEWFLRCLQRTPAERYGHAREAWQALREQAAHQAPPSHVLPPQVASLAAEAAAADSHAETHPGSTTDIEQAWTATRETRSPDGAQAAGDAQDSKTQTSTGDTAPNDQTLASIEGISNPGDSAGDIESTDSPGDISSAEAAPANVTSADLQAASSTPADSPLSKQRVWLIAALAVGLIATAVSALRNAPPTISPAQTTEGSAAQSAPRPSRSVAPASNAASTSAPTSAVEPPALQRAQEALRQGKLRDAERHAQELLDTLGGVAGRRPRTVEPTLDGAEAQRVLVQVALARAAKLTPDDSPEAHQSLLDEAKIDCDKARTWSSEPDAHCCRTELAAYFLTQAEAEPQDKRTLLGRAQRHLDEIPTGASRCAAQQQSLNKRTEQLARPRNAPGPSPPAAPPSRNFDAQQAERALNTQIAKARAQCSRLIGARSHSFRVSWHPSGAANVAGASSDPTSSCIARVLRAAAVERFEPDSAPPAKSITITLAD